jgi:hypothetical protein
MNRNFDVISQQFSTALLSTRHFITAICIAVNLPALVLSIRQFTCVSSIPAALLDTPFSQPNVFHTIRSTPRVSLDYEIVTSSIAIKQMHVGRYDELLQ